MASSLARIALHLALVVCLVVPGTVAAAQGIVDAVAAIAVDDAAQPPCDDMAMPGDENDAPCDCCTPDGCTLAACIGTALPAPVLRLVAAQPIASAPIAWHARDLPPGVIDTPLRPPIG